MVALLCALLVLVPIRPAEAAARPAINWHVVAPGQTLSSLAARYGVRASDLIRWNQLDRSTVQVDATLRLNKPKTPLPAWRTRVERVTPAMISWDPRRNCPVGPADLRRIWVSYIDFRGAYHDGYVIMHRNLVARTQGAFLTMFRWRFRIMVMQPASVNMPGLTSTTTLTTGFKCRTVHGSGNWSEHAYGRALDINPLQNAMFEGSYIEPPAGAPWRPRDRYLIGMIHAEGVARIFAANGFYWGGGWRYTKDYMHFSTSNR
jgi:LysM repeat protein